MSSGHRNLATMASSDAHWARGWVLTLKLTHLNPESYINASIVASSEALWFEQQET